MGTSDSGSVVERLRQAFEMYDLGVAMKRQQLKRAYPDEPDALIAARVQAWLDERPDETEWVGGKRVSWPRDKEVNSN